MLTRNGICKNLEESPYLVTIIYSNARLEYIFSSNLYKEMFIKRLKSNRDYINKSLSKRFGLIIDNPILCDIKLYSMVEKRGFLIKDEHRRYTWLTYIKLDGVNQIEQSLED